MDFAIVSSPKHEIPVLVFRDSNDDGEDVVVVKCYSPGGYDYEETHRFCNVDAAQNFVDDFSGRSADRIASETLKLDEE